MSRWIEQYKNHSYAAVWQQFKESLDVVELDDESVQTSVQELSRLRKATVYLDGLINTVDPELVPLSTWDSFQKQSAIAKQQLDQFAANRNIAHLQSANNNVDNLLTYIRPYMVVVGDAASALRNATLDAAEQISERFHELQQHASQTIKSIENCKTDADSHLEGTTKIYDRITDFERRTFGDDQTEGTEQKINSYISGIKDQFEKISNYYNEVFTGIDDNPSIKQQISLASDDVQEDRKLINTLLSAVEEKTDRLSDFYIKIFGSTENETKSKGLAGELEERKAELKLFESEQKQRYKALNDEINSLLPGATAAGLASAYYDMKMSFEKPIKNASRLFYGSIGILVISSLLLSIESIGGSALITFVDLSQWDSIIKSLIYKLPLYGPVIWLAFYASKRRSECQRLQQEYAHKEALAKSYQSYKLQIEALNAEDEDMLKSLITKAIDTIVYNAAETLDKGHGDKPPVHEVIEKTIDRLVKGDRSKTND